MHCEVDCMEEGGRLHPVDGSPAPKGGLSYIQPKSRTTRSGHLKLVGEWRCREASRMKPEMPRCKAVRCDTTRLVVEWMLA